MVAELVALMRYYRTVNEAPAVSRIVARYVICKKRRFCKTLHLRVEQAPQCNVKSRPVMAAVMTALCAAQ